MANDKDREVAATQKLMPNNSTPLQKGPRRMWADPKGNTVWVTEYFADQLARIDIHTKEVKEYPMPHRWSQPYAVNVDKNHNVWVTMQSSDQIFKLDAKTGKWTQYNWPTIGTNTRHISIFEQDGRTQILGAHFSTSAVGRMIIRSPEDVQALKVQSQSTDKN